MKNAPLRILRVGRISRLWMQHAACALLMLALTGCATNEAPVMTIVGARIQSTSEEATVVDFVFDVENPNTQPLPLRTFEYALSVEGGQIFSSRRSAEATIPQNSTQRIVLPAVISHARFGGVPNGTLECVVRGRLFYVAPGAFAEALFDSRIRVPSTTFSAGGPVDFDSTAESPEAADSPTRDPDAERSPNAGDSP